ncbi:MAG: S8 family serine peptidase [Pseudomonadota bacterium]
MEWSATDGDAPINPVLAFRQNLHSQNAGGAADHWWSALLDLRDSSIEQLLARLGSAFPGQIILPSVYSPEDRQAHKARQLMVVFAKAPALEALNRTGAHEFNVYGVADGMVHDSASVNASARFHPPPKVPVADTGSVVMGIIDDGIAIANDLFRTGPTSSRVENAWVMEAPFVETDGQNQTIGRSISRAQINDLLRQHTAGGFLDEARFYQSTGQITFADAGYSPVSAQRSHGTHIAAVAAGAPMHAAISTRPIICATLPPRVTVDVTGQSSLPAVALALQHLHHQAKSFVFDGAKGDPVPVVLNFSFGNFSGPHDGTGEIDFLLEQFITQGGAQLRKIVLPAGNGNLSRTHAEVPLKPRKNKRSRKLRLVSPPDDRTASHVQFWIPRDASHVARFRATPPGGPKSPVLSSQEGTPAELVLRNGSGDIIARLTRSHIPAPVNRCLISLSFNPTESLTPSNALMRAGHWKIAIKGAGCDGMDAAEVLDTDAVQSWIRRDETVPGFAPGGRQPRFEDARYKTRGTFGRPLATDPKRTRSLIRREGTLSGYATGAFPVVVAALEAKTKQLSTYSASGPLSPGPDQTPTRIGPDVAARGDDSAILRGVISAGSASGSFVRMSGTSVAAPAVARAVADELCGKPMIPKPIKGAPKLRCTKGYLDIDLHLQGLPEDILNPY